VVDQEFFDARIARPFLVLLAFNLFGLLCAIARSFSLPTFGVPSWLSFVNWPAHLYDGNHLGTICVNAMWALFNVIILGVATAVARESQQRRRTVRVAMAVPSDLILADGSMIQGITSDLSGGGVRTLVDHAVKAQVGDPIRFVFPVLDGTATLPATIVAVEGSELRARFDQLTLQEDEALAMILYSRADAWLGWSGAREADRPLRSMAHILRLSLRGIRQVVGSNDRKRSPKSRLATSVVPLIVFALLASHTTQNVRAAEGDSLTSPAKVATQAPSRTFDNVSTLAELGAPESIELRGVDASYSLSFSAPGNQVIESATLKLRYHFSPGLLPGVSHLNVSLNGTLLTTLAVVAPANPIEQTTPLEATVNLPSNLLVRHNRLTFESIGHYTLQCEDPSNSTLWSRVDSDSTLELTGAFQPVANDLAMLPLPFYDAGVAGHPQVPIVFLAQPSPKAMQAAAIVTSWIGIQAGDRPVQFPVSITTIPSGNAIVLAESTSSIPRALASAGLSGPMVAIRDNPSDPDSKVLIVAGGNADELLTAAMALASHGETWQGSQVSVQDFTMPAPRKPDDAPRWLSTDKANAAELGRIARTSDLQGDGSAPLAVTMRVPPDLDFGESRNLALHLSYRYNAVPLGDGSTLQTYVNGAYVSSTPMPHRDKASAVMETVVPVPAEDMRPFSNAMAFKFVFNTAKNGGCGDSARQNLQGAVLKESYLDVSDAQHLAVLPNLELFANAGFPFTRQADLASTAVVLPDQPTVAELEMFLAMMGHFGAQTGYPVLRVTVTNAAGMSGDANKDYLVMGAVRDQPALQALGDLLPVGVDESGLHIRDTQSIFDRGSAWGRRGADQGEQGQLDTAGGLPDALIEGIEWPHGSNHSVVVVVVRDEETIPNFLSSFLNASQSQDIAQSVGVLHGTQFSSYRIGSDFYRVGDISWLMRVTMLFQEFPWLIAIVTVMFCFLLAVLLQAVLRRRARARLQHVEELPE